MKTSTLEDRSPIIKAESFEQNGRSENVCIFGEDEEPDDDVFAKVFSVAGTTALTTTHNDHSTCYRLPCGGKGPKPLIARFVCRDTEDQLMKHNTILVETSIYVKDYLTPLCASIIRGLRTKNDVSGVVTANKKIFVLFRNNRNVGATDSKNTKT